MDRARFNGFTVLTNVPVTMPTGASNYINDRLKGTLRPLTNYVGTPRTAQPFESGPKDVVHAAPFSVTRIVMFWPTNALFYLTPSAKSLNPSTSGRYVYHCHILDHEDDDMMRPLQLLPVALQMVQMPDPGVNVAGNNHFRLGISGRFGETYRIESSTSLPGTWVPLRLPDLAGSEDLIRIVPPSTLDPLTFYRVRRVSP